MLRLIYRLPWWLLLTLALTIASIIIGGIRGIKEEVTTTFSWSWEMRPWKRIL